MRERPESGGDPTGQLGAEEVRSRATRGAALLGARGALIYAVGTVANLVLARLLVPRDFGIVALGTVLLVVGTFLADGGLGAALIQRERSPARTELEAVYGLQLAVTGAFAAVFAAVAATFGDDGLVVAVMVAAVPLATLRMPSMIVLERRLEYRVVATADVLEAVSYYLWAVGGAALGFGVWGLATAAPVRSIVGSTILIVRGPVGLVRPRWSWHSVQPLLGFGVKFQTTRLLQLVQQQGISVGVAAVSGVGVLGVWNLAWRVLQVPILLFIEANRVAFPSMSRLLGAGHEVRSVIERGAATLAALTGAVTVALLGLAPLLPSLVGGKWDAVPKVLLWSGFALVLGIPTTVSTSAYLFASGAAGAVAIAALLSTLVWFGLSLPLLPTLGAEAIALGWVASCAVYAGMLWRASAARIDVALGRRLAVPTAFALIANGVTWLVADSAPSSPLAAIGAIVLGETVLLGGLALLARAALRDTRSLVALALGRSHTPAAVHTEVPASRS